MSIFRISILFHIETVRYKLQDLESTALWTVLVIYYITNN
ncbi:hypothetical protein HMPREF0860_1524 [Treponema socranskii subsp. socranskii VPI DR56BR1116 = ATCC 35536]|uniref:Uncharacterized protein n=1 Tax=Treponema socranskii subsp. socranskii VPI DR56BR1116 = ATCC 35536 TaxID=1125725 RepID=U2LI81_TRESO|nr:hypothetical protein HMPREF1325_2498 [Treponema socranskii subsp. socranskii VPI DR56BR1116 = ATCC 35536]ERK04153.1 hypothetical protein HMPREF0860_1524 [Treponema socranskii subsp. socranskii VPI DR56BR1116 = ATCC 35536]